MKTIGKIDFALINGKVNTLNSEDDVAEAIAVAGGKIVSIGKTKEVESMLGSETEIYDVRGKTVLPGFIESHCHPSAAGLKMCFA